MHKREGHPMPRPERGYLNLCMEGPGLLCLCMESDLLPPCNQLYLGTLFMKDCGNIDGRRTSSQNHDCLSAEAAQIMVL